MREIELFKKKYKDIMEEKGLKVEYFGSTKDCRRWRKGESDLDIFVYRNNIPLEVKVEGVLLVRELNYELNLELENVPFQHWTPIYIDSPGRLILKVISEEGIIRYFTESLRDVMKGSSIQWPITYSEWWDIVEFAYRHRSNPLSAIFLKLL